MLVLLVLFYYPLFDGRYFSTSYDFLSTSYERIETLLPQLCFSCSDIWKFLLFWEIEKDLNQSEFLTDYIICGFLWFFYVNISVSFMLVSISKLLLCSFTGQAWSNGGEKAKRQRSFQEQRLQRSVWLFSIFNSFRSVLLFLPPSSPPLSSDTTTTTVRPLCLSLNLFWTHFVVSRVGGREQRISSLPLLGVDQF